MNSMCLAKSTLGSKWLSNEPTTIIKAVIGHSMGIPHLEYCNNLTKHTPISFFPIWVNLSLILPLSPMLGKVSNCVFSLAQSFPPKTQYERDSLYQVYLSYLGEICQEIDTKKAPRASTNGHQTFPSDTRLFGSSSNLEVNIRRDICLLFCETSASENEHPP